jgi:hypothetical protein
MSRIRSMNPQASGQAVLHPRSAPFWATAAIDGAADTSPMELFALGAHIDRCNGSRGRMFGLRCAVDAIHGFIAPRFVTTLIVIGLVFGVASLVL